jgi:hypothetical protein
MVGWAAGTSRRFSRAKYQMNFLKSLEPNDPRHKQIIHHVHKANIITKDKGGECIETSLNTHKKCLAKIL